jgi:hypothetical protein
MPTAYNENVTAVPVRLSANIALKERRLAELLGGRDPGDPALAEVVRDAQVLGSLQLAGFDVAWETVRAARRGAPAPPEVAGLQRAQAAVAASAPISVAALLAWHAAVVGGQVGFRTSARARAAGPAPAPPEFVRGRLEILEQWLESQSARSLTPAQGGALALARVVELQPFESGNGRVSRLAASHQMLRAGARLPVLIGADRPRLQAALEAAFQLDTGPLSALLEEAAGRALDVMIQELEAEARRA